MKVCKSVRGAVKFDRLAPIPKLSERSIVCVYKMPLPKMNAITLLPTAVWQKTGSPKWALSFPENTQV